MIPQEKKLCLREKGVGERERMVFKEEEEEEQVCEETRLYMSKIGI